MKDENKTKERLLTEMEMLKGRLAELEKSKLESMGLPGAILNAKKEWERIFDSVSDLVMIVDKDYRIRRVNQAMADKLGLPFSKVVGRLCFNCVHDLVEPPSFCPHTQVLNDEQEHSAEFYEERLGGYFQVKASPFYDSQGQLVGSALVGHDVSKEKEVDRMKTEFVSIVSHELRTPLNNITEAMAQVMDGLYGDINQNQNEILALAHRNCRRLGRIISDLLDISRIEAGEVVLKKSFLDISQVVERVIGQFERPAKKKSILLKAKIAPRLPLVFADPDRLEQILVNLVGNALKFTRRGGELGVEATEKGGYVECSVTDTGIGIAPENIKQLFIKFKRFAPAQGEGRIGAGLGLAISRQLVEIHGGEIWVESQLNQGSRFIFKLPDYKSEIVFRDYLKHSIDRKEVKHLPLALQGIELANWPELRERLGDKTSYFFDQLVGVLARELGPRFNIWQLVDTGELMIIWESGVSLKVGRIEEKILKIASGYQFLIHERPIKIGLKLASAKFPDDASTATRLVEVLRQRLSQAKPLPIPPRKVLVVDDQKGMVDLLSALLRKKNIKVVEAYSGEQALKLVQAEPIDLILLDIVMPEMSGYEVIGRLKEKKDTSNIPLIIVTAFTIDEIKLKAVTPCAIPSVNKPIDQNWLIKLVYEALNLTRVVI